MRNFRGLIIGLFLFVMLSNAQVLIMHRGAKIDTISLFTVDSIAFDTTASVLRDIDGNEYRTVKIGNQWWMAENLKVTHYNNGDVIPNVTEDAKWGSLHTGAYCSNNNDNGNVETYGLLYNWYAVDDDSLAPIGWHVPTDEDFTELENFLISCGYNYDGTVTDNKIAKSLSAKTDWLSSSNDGAIGNDFSENNSSGFTALPGGMCDSLGWFNGSISNIGCWWSSESGNSVESLYRNLFYRSSCLGHAERNKKCGFSVRLVKD